MRFVASTFLSVAILAFVTQSISAGPVGANDQVEEVGQASSSNLDKDGMDNIDAFGGNETSNTNVRDVNIAILDLLSKCMDGIVPDEICNSVFGDLGLL
jgi:hypothetical protein